jgi:hypothetical protein
VAHPPPLIATNRCPLTRHSPVLLSIQVGQSRAHGTKGTADPLDRPWRNGCFKRAVPGPIFLGRTNLDGDGQADLMNHGGEATDGIYAFSGGRPPSERECRRRRADVPERSEG